MGAGMVDVYKYYGCEAKYVSLLTSFTYRPVCFVLCDFTIIHHDLILATVFVNA